MRVCKAPNEPLATATMHVYVLHRVSQYPEDTQERTVEAVDAKSFRRRQ